MIPLAANPEKRRYSFEQYITLLRNNDQRLEYDHGEIYAMAGSSANHAAISANMWRALDDALGEDAMCRAYMVDRVVRLTPDVIVMPDVVVTCDRADQGDAFFLNSPRIVVEVLSKSTEARDRTYKLLRYQAKQSIQEIVLISQYVQHVEVITRTPSGWEYQEYGHEERFTLVSLNVTIRVSDIYRRLSIPIEKHTFMPLEVIEPADEQEDS
ncbi:MAG: Uma2 family endonuclease [Chloroflexota bacterium]|nr:Uma2 family endonuclease [Chloroflexota bacterium]